MQRELTGVPPMTFVSNGENLVDYRIYGATGGVGDRTGNLFDKNSAVIINQAPSVWTEDSHLSSSVAFCDITLSVVKNTTYTIKKGAGNKLGVWAQKANNRAAILFANDNNATSCQFYSGDYTTVYVHINNRSMEGGNVSDEELINNLMLCEGNTIPETYEPYGYKVPIVCGGTTTNIYLNEPLGENESISMSDTGLSIPTINGSNTLNVDTAIQPNSVYIKYATNERSVPARTYLQGVEEMDNWAIYNYINREGMGSLINESTVTSTTVEVRKTIRFTGAASGGTAPYQYAFYYKRRNASDWTTKSDYGAASYVDFTPQNVDTYYYKVNVKYNKGTIRSKVFTISVTPAAASTQNFAPISETMSFDNTDELTVDIDLDRADLTIEDNNLEEA